MSRVTVKSIDTATLSAGPSCTPSASVDCEMNWIEIQYVSSIPENMPKHMEAAELTEWDIMPVELGMRFVITDVNQTRFRKTSIITGNKPTRVFLPLDADEVLFTFEGERPSETLGVPEAEKPGKKEESWFGGIARGVVSGSIRGANQFLTAIDDLSMWLDEKVPLGGIVVDTREGFSIRWQSSKEINDLKSRGVKSVGDLRIPEIDRPTSTVGQMTEGAAQFLVGFIPAVRGVRVLSGGAALTSTGKLAQFAIAGAVADATVFDPHEKRLSDLIQQYPALQNPVTEYLASDPGDSKAEGRLKNALEGLILGAVLDGFVRGLRVMKYGVTRTVARLPSKHRYIFYSETLDAVVDVMLRAARKMEPRVTALLQDIARRTNGTMAGLEFRLKTDKSLSEKIVRDATGSGEIYSVAAAKIKDVLRYTIVYSEKDYRRAVQEAIDALYAKGYKKIRIKNAWSNPPGEYKGINAAFETPRGYEFELQFHTKASLDAKQMSHGLYEQQRQLSPKDPLYKKLETQQAKIFENVPIPPGARDIR